MLAAVSFPIYVRALVNAVLGREQQWHVTGATTRASSPFNFMIPQVLMFVFLLLTAAVGVWQNWTHSTVTLGTAWNLTNTFILGAFMVVAWREAHRVRRGLPVATRRAAATTHPTAAPARWRRRRWSRWRWPRRRRPVRRPWPRTRWPAWSPAPATA